MSDEIIENEAPETIKRVTVTEALNAMRTLEEYFQNYPSGLEIFYKLEDAFLKKRCEEQSRIDNFFLNDNIE